MCHDKEYSAMLSCVPHNCIHIVAATAKTNACGVNYIVSITATNYVNYWCNTACQSLVPVLAAATARRALKGLLHARPSSGHIPAGCSVLHGDTWYKHVCLLISPHRTVSIALPTSFVVHHLRLVDCTSTAAFAHVVMKHQCFNSV